MMKIRFMLLIVVLFSLAVPVAAQQSNFSVTPPPIASPTFEAGKSDMRVGLLYLSIKGENVDLTGGGVNFIGRSAFNDTFAGDFSVGFIGMSADMGAGSTLSLLTLPFSVNLEVQAIKTDGFSTIFFAGPNFTLTSGSMELNIAGSTSTATITQTLFGFQGGVQAGIKAGDFMISPFAMFMTQSGSSTVSTEFGDTTMTIDPFTTKSYGLDIMYTPWGLTLSSIAQQAAEQQTDTTTQAGYKTKIYQISWVKQF